MREIKFRGKRKGGSEWLIGDLNNINGKVYIFPRPAPNSPDWYEVDPASVGQFTGKSDMKGLDIYGGDQIGDWVDVDGKIEQSRQTVYFDEMLGQWMLDNSLKQDRTLSYSLFSELQDFKYEVIGNIYDPTK